MATKKPIAESCTPRLPDIGLDLRGDNAASAALGIFRFRLKVPSSSMSIHGAEIA